MITDKMLVNIQEDADVCYQLHYPEPILKQLL